MKVDQRSLRHGSELHMYSEYYFMPLLYTCHTDISTTIHFVLVWQVSPSTILAYSLVYFVQSIQNPRVKFRQVILHFPQDPKRSSSQSFILCTLQLGMDEATVEVESAPVTLEGLHQSFNLGV